MTPQPVSVAVVEQYAKQLVESSSSARIFALEAPPDWSGPAEFVVGDVKVHVRGCPSALAIREALSDIGTEDYLVLLTDREATDLGASLTSQFHHSRIHAVDPWGAVAQMFAAAGVASDLRSLGLDVAAAIAAWRPAEGYPPMPAGAVTADHAAGSLMAAVLNIALPIDTAALLRVSLEPGAKQRWQSLPDPARQALRAWASKGVGAIAPTVLDVLDAPSPLDAVTIGLAADVLWAPSGGHDAVRAQGRLETYTAGRPMDAVAARGLAQAAKNYVAALPTSDGGRSSLLARAETLLADLQWEEGAEYSDILQAGLHARVRSVAAAIDAVMAGSGNPEGVEAALSSLYAHWFVQGQPQLARTSEMAVRLLRWLGTADIEPRTLAQALRRQIDIDGWVDWAISEIWSGSADPQVATAYARLAQAVQQRRRIHDAQFAELLSDSGTTASSGEFIGVESVLAELIAPIAQSTRVMLIVVDGMSTAVASELAGDIAGRGWVEMVRGISRTPVVAALPTLTRYSRTSLFSATLTDGGQADEKRAIAAMFPGAALFHKADLRAQAGHALPPTVREAAASAATVVAAVVNTVDDALAKADPDGTQWNLGTIQHVRALLDLAAATDRTVVITSDHGHVVERGSRRVEAAGAEARFRPAVGDTHDGEVLLEGTRVINGPVIAAVQEDIRYGNRAAGYHGGASPVEVTIPFLVFTRAPEMLVTSGWLPAPPQEPEWWQAPVVPGAGVGGGIAGDALRPTTRRPRRTVVEPEGMEALFDAEPAASEGDTGPSPQVSTDPTVQARAVAEAVISSAPYRARVGEPPGRGMPDAKVTIEALTCLLARGGRAHQDVVARAIAVPKMRLRGAVSTLSRALNIDGYQVISFDADDVTVVVDERLLREQFQLPRGGQ